ncbi:glycosyltransferase [Elioraea sp.]|uniref:glycosyltransferase n=1 Tax=Elioraea sp. TaxID=2185103 RepID=UPI0025BB2794|nr:glycosyltransferase [Elioraea sp.]
MKVAIVHEWLDTYAGSERVLEQLLLAWPDADLFVVCDFLPSDERGFLGGRVPRTTFIQRLPFARKHFRKYLSLMPMAVEQHDLSGYDLVLSSNHAVAKGVLTGPGQLHVSYIHSPMRYAWDLQHQYLRESGLDRGIKGAMTRLMLHKLRIWDRASAAGVDILVANSSYIAERIRKVWRRESVVVHPPVAVQRFTLRREKQEHYLVASRMVPYKRIELVTAAFRRMPGRKLVVIGDGPNMKTVREAAGDAGNITFLGRVSQPELIARMQGARAALHAAEEDFGIAIVEAQACGTPMIAYGRGGALDIVRAPPANDPTGVFFADQTADSIIAAVEEFEALGDAITAEACRENAMRFGEPVFRDAMRALVARQMGER